MRAMTVLLILISALGFSLSPGEEARTFYLTVNAPLEGCRVFVNGAELGKTPLVTQLSASNFDIHVISPNGKQELKETVENISEERIIILADFSKKRIQIFRTQREIVEYVDYEARIAKFRKHYLRALEHLRMKELMCALLEVDSALESYNDTDARLLLLSLRKQLLPQGFVYVEGGQFNMGVSNRGNYALEYPGHPVIVSDFAISAYELTNAEFMRFIAETSYTTTVEIAGSAAMFDDSSKQWKLIGNASWKQPLGKNCSTVKKDMPVCMVSWSDAMAYAKWANSKLDSTAFEIRLPTEAEWEYVASSGGKSNYPWHSSCSEKDNVAALGTAWFHKGGSFPRGASAQGAYDIIGNLWEWTIDIADDQYYTTCLIAGVVVDPTGASTGDFRVARGGSYLSSAGMVNARTRRFLYEEYVATDVGIRLVIAYKSKITTCE